MFRTTLVGRSIRAVARTLVGRIRAIARYSFAEMEYEPGGWRVIEGWSADLVVQAQEKHWPTLVSNLQGTGPLGVAHFPWHRTREDRDDHNVMMSFGYVLALAARKRDAVSVLDWGGGVGHYYLYGRALLPEVELEYHCYDLPGFCRLGRTSIWWRRFALPSM